MANKYEEKKVYYIPAFVEKIRELGKCPVKVSFRIGEERCVVDFENSPGLLFTAEEVAENVDTIARSALDEYSEKAQRKIEALTKQLEEANETIKAFSESEDIVRTNFDAKVDENRELKSRNAELEALLKEVMATRDEAIKQNDELLAENSKLKSDCNDWKDTADERIVAVQNLTAERDNLKADLDQRNKDFWAMKKDRDELDSIGGKLRAENENLKAWYNEANKTASEAAEANDDLKAKITDLRNRVGEQLAQIQDLNAEVHFLKEKGGKPTEETTKTLHVVLNDGTEIEFRRYTAYDYRTDIKMFVVKDGERFIAGFNRGDKSFNFAYWWTE